MRLMVDIIVTKRKRMFTAKEKEYAGCSKQ